jgi:Ca2+-binding RTX toxin-like protein
MEFAAPAFVHRGSPDGSPALFEIDDTGGDYGRIVPTEDPSGAVDLPMNSGRSWFVDEQWSHVFEVRDTAKVYTIDGSFVRDLTPSGAVFSAAVLPDAVVTAKEGPTFSVVVGYDISTGSTKRLSGVADQAFVIGSYDGLVYWTEYGNGECSIWRARPDGTRRAKLTKGFTGTFDPYAETAAVSGRLVYEADDDLWSMDLTALPDHACFDRLATHTGTPKRDVIDGTPGNDVIVSFGGNDVIRGGDGRDRICAGKGSDRVIGNADGDWLRGKGGDDVHRDIAGANDADGGPGTDLCKITGATAACEQD